MGAVEYSDDADFLDKHHESLEELLPVCKDGTFISMRRKLSLCIFMLPKKDKLIPTVSSYWVSNLGVFVKALDPSFAQQQTLCGG